MHKVQKANYSLEPRSRSSVHSGDETRLTFCRMAGYSLLVELKGCIVGQNGAEQKVNDPRRLSCPSKMPSERPHTYLMNSSCTRDKPTSKISRFRVISPSWLSPTPPTVLPLAGLVWLRFRVTPQVARRQSSS